jgi:hypothetical protein
MMQHSSRKGHQVGRDTAGRDTAEGTPGGEERSQAAGELRRLCVLRNGVSTEFDWHNVRRH